MTKALPWESSLSRLHAAATVVTLSIALAGCDAGSGDPIKAAQEALANGEPRTALDLAAIAIDANQDNPVIRLVAGDAAMALGDPDRAIAEFEQVPESAPLYSLAQAKLAEAQVLGNYLEGAGDTLASLQMDNPTSYLAKIAYHFAQAETEIGFQLVEQGLDKFPKNPRLITIDAERLWAQGQASKAFERLEPVLAITPAVAQAHLFAGRLSLGSRDALEAENHFQKVLSVQPNQQTAMLALAAIARDRGDTQEAGNWIEKANEAGTPHPIGLLFAAQMAFDAGDVMRALELVEKAPAAIVSEPEFTRLRGMIDAARDQHAMAALALGDYVDATGGDPMARQVLANSLAQQGEFNQAWSAIAPVVDHPQLDGTGLVLALRLAEQTGKGDPERIRNQIARRGAGVSIVQEMRQASAAIRRGDWVKADRIYAPLLIGAAKNDPALLNNAAAVKTKLGEHDEAIRLGRRALKEAPNNPEIMDTLGWALWQKGGHATEARRLLQKAIEGAPSNREIADHWAIAHAD